MAEEFQNTISLYGPVDAVEEMARLIGVSLFKNLESESTDEFVLLWNDVAQPNSPQNILYQMGQELIIDFFKNLEAKNHFVFGILKPARKKVSGSHFRKKTFDLR